MKPISKRAAVAMAIVIVAAHLAAVAVLAATVPWTPDERGYLLAGRNLVLGLPWEVPEERFQGPLGLLANQLFVGDFGTDRAAIQAVRTSARLGMLVFPLLLLTVLGVWARQLFGRGAMLLALFLAATNPTLLAYGPLLAVDVALAATALAMFWLLWRWLHAPGVVPWAGAGVATGAMLGTKYIALLFAAAVPLVVGVAVLRGADPAPWRRRTGERGLARRLLGALAALIGMGVIALLVLHACYLFRAPLWDPSQAGGLGSAALGTVAAVPGGTLLLGLLPEPFVLGADYQAAIARALPGKAFLDWHGSHPAHYPASLVLKTPLGTLALLGLALVAPAVVPPRVPRFAGLCIGIPVLLLLTYLVVASGLQMGIRYLTPVVVLMILRASGWAASSWAARPWGKAVTALACASTLLAAISAWPHHIGYFHTLAGGPAGGFHWFADGNCDWGQRYRAGADALRARHGDLEVLRPGEGPRFGKIAAYALDLKPEDPRRPGRTYHWITRFPVVDHDSAAWLVFDASLDRFERAAQRDPRAAYDLALAWLREREFDRAAAALELAGDDPRVGALRGTIRLARRAAGGDDDARRAVVERLDAAGHAELALLYLGDVSREQLPGLVSLLVRSGRLGEAVEMLRARASQDELRPVEVLLLAAGVLWQADPIGALAVLERGPAPEPSDPLAPVWQKFVEQVRNGVRAVEKMEGAGASHQR